MYKRKLTRGPSSLTPNVPKPVVLSQKRPQSTAQADKENTDEVPSSQDVPEDPASQNEVPSSQNEVTEVTSQSRFLSQRHQVIRLTQGEQIRGKNFFEIALISSKIKVTTIGCELEEGDDPISFTRRFRAFLSSGAKENAKKFIDGFKLAFSLNKVKIAEAQKYLTGCIMKESHKTAQSQTSLVQCFFAVSSLKDEVAKILLDNLKAYVTKRGELADGRVVGLVVAQFKFSDQMLTSEAYNAFYERLFDILKSTKSDACREVIIENFRDLDEFKQDEAVKRLLNLYEDEQEKLTPFIEMFTEMSLNDDTKVRITSLVQHILDDKCDPKLYPGIVKYLLHYMNSSDEIVLCLRKNMKWTVRSNSSSDVVQLLEKSVRREKSKMGEAWIKAVLSAEEPDRLNTVDFVMLLAVLSVKEEKLPTIKKLLLQKVPGGFFNAEYIKLCFQTFPSIIVQYSETLLELLNALQKSNLFEINEFSSVCFKQLFAIKSSDKKEIVGSLVQFLCEKTAQTPFSAKSDFKMMTLTILDEISQDQKSAKDLLINHKILLRVLDISKVKLTINEHRLMLELLCTLAYKTNYRESHKALEVKRLEEEQGVLQEHLEMMSHKLNSNPDMNIKQLGIISAVKILSAQVVNVVSNSEDSSGNIAIENMPPGPIKNAAKLVEFIFDSVKENAVGLAIIYDELTMEFAGKGNQIDINGMFLNWLSELMMFKLSEVAGIALSVQLPDLDAVSLCHKLPVDTPEISQPEFALQLGLMVFQAKSETAVFLPALFKLARVLLLHRYHSLNELGLFANMPITLTDTFNTADEEISVDEALAKQQFDLYFYCINWLRELVGAFCHQTQTDGDDFAFTVVTRLKQLVTIEKRLLQLLQDLPPNYYPPPASFFDIEVKKKLFDSLRKEKRVVHKASKPPKKTRKKNDSSAVNVTRAEQFDACNKIRQFCREIDTHSIVLLKKKFNFRSENLPVDEFGLEELVFICDDIFNKIKPIFSARSAEQKGLFDPIKTFQDLKESILAELAAIFHETCEELVTLSQKADADDTNDVLFTHDANLIKSCFSLILQMFEVLFSCPKLKLEKNRELLEETLKCLVPDDMLTDDDIYSNVVKHYCITLQLNVKNIDSAVSLAKFLQTISSLSSNEELQVLVLELCEKFLKREWKNSAGDDEHGAAFNANLDKLLQIFIKDAKFADIEQNVSQMSEDFQFIISKKLEFQKSFPSFNRGNSALMMRAYLSRMSQILSISDLNQMDYNFWSKCIKTYNLIIEIVKCIGHPNALIAFLKEVLVFLRVFNVHGVATMKLNVNNKKKFLHIIDGSQKITRFSHGASCDLKHRKNKSIVSIVPKLREALTKNFQLVSSLFPLANIPPSEIHLGTLKNFDINNDEIWSQNTTTTSSNASGLADDDEDDVTMNSDDDTLDNLEAPRADSDQQQSSFRSRSTIL